MGTSNPKQAKPVTGGRVKIPRSRSLVTDILRLSTQVPTCTQVRTMDLASLRDARRELSERVSWPVIFIKAYSAVSAQNPPLLQTWRRFPWPHLYQHTEPSAVITVMRRFRDQDWLFWGRLRSPQTRSLHDLQRRLASFTTGPIESTFQKQLRFTALPALLRRVIWWWNLNLVGDKRAKRLGTFLLTTVAGRGAETQHPPSLLTSCISYGPLDENGHCRVRLVYDHRLMDGAFVADRLAELESELRGEILQELRMLTANQPKPAIAA